MAQGGVKLAAIGALLLAGACAAPAAKTPVKAAPTQAPAPPPPAAIAAPPPSAPAAASVSSTPAPPPDPCGAQSLQYLIGKPHTDIPAPLTPADRRVLCSACVASQGFKPYRQTITYDSQTGLVTSVKCG